MAEADAPATCPAGHADTTRLLSVFASSSGAAMPSPQGSAGGGCCGGACGCG